MKILKSHQYFFGGRRDGFVTAAEKKKCVCVYSERGGWGGGRVYTHIQVYAKYLMPCQETGSGTDTEVPSEYYLENEGN